MIQTAKRGIPNSALGAILIISCLAGGFAVAHVFEWSAYAATASRGGEGLSYISFNAAISFILSFLGGIPASAISWYLLKKNPQVTIGRIARYIWIGPMVMAIPLAFVPLLVWPQMFGRLLLLAVFVGYVL